MCHEAVGELRLKSMFEVVVEYPDSQPAVRGGRLHDLLDFLDYTGLWWHEFWYHLVRSASARRRGWARSKQVELGCHPLTMHYVTSHEMS